MGFRVGPSRIFKIFNFFRHYQWGFEFDSDHSNIVSLIDPISRKF